jgi:hypothetical protein
VISVMPLYSGDANVQRAADAVAPDIQ